MKHVAAALTVKDRESVFGPEDYSALAPIFFISVPDQWSIKFYGGDHSAK